MFNSSENSKSIVGHRNNDHRKITSAAKAARTLSATLLRKGS